MATGAEGEPRRVPDIGYPVLDWVPDAVFLADPATGRLVDANSRALELIGRSLEEVRSMSFEQLHPPDLLPSVRARFERAIHERAPRPFETLVITSDGRMVPVEISAAGLVELHGRQLLLGVFRNLSERKKAVADLADAKERMRALIEAAPLGVFEYQLGEDGRLIFLGANRAADRILNTSCRQFIGLTIQEAFPPLAETELPEAYCEVARAGRAFEKELVNYDHGEIAGAFEVAAFQTAPGRMAVMFRDITGRKRAEMELLQAKEEAEEASRSKDRLLAAVSHELRTPLNPVLMAVHAWERDASLPGQLREDLRMVRRQIELEARLIKDLLDYMAISHGKMRVEFFSVDANELLEYLRELIAADAQQKRITLRLELRAERHHVFSDPERLQQVLSNIFENALKFTPEGGSISIRTRNEGSDLKIEVADTGIGINPEMLHKVLEPFEQANAGTHSGRNGLGLGLAITRGILQLMGGTLELGSQGPGQGSHVTVSLPVTDRLAG